MTLLKLTALVLLCMASALGAAINFSYSFELTAYSDDDDLYGLNGSTFTVDMQIASDVYVASSFSDLQIPIDFVTLTISGASGGYDGVYNLTQTADNGEGTAPILWINASRMFLPIAPPVFVPHWTASDSITIDSMYAYRDGFDMSANAGDPVNASDFDGLSMVCNSITFTDADLGTVGYSCTNLQPLSASSVPEPSGVAAFIGIGALTFVGIRRRNKLAA